MFGNRFGSGGVDRNQGLVCAPVELGVVVAVERKHLQEGVGSEVGKKVKRGVGGGVGMKVKIGEELDQN